MPTYGITPLQATVESAVAIFLLFLGLQVKVNN